MAEALISNSESNTLENRPSASSSSGSLFHRRIDFHLARKPFSGFTNGVGGFHLETLNPGADQKRPAPIPAPSASTGKKQDGSDHMESGLDPELSFGITFRRIGAGLENLGNTCYLNSVLQCLTYTEPLAAYLQSSKHQNSCHIAGFCALCAIQKHVSRALQSTGRILAPKDLVSNLRCISRNFRNARQEDAHEYMVNLLESMHKCCLPSGVPSESPGAYEKSLVHKIFGGRLRSQVKCMQCSYCSNKFDPFLDLSLEIVKADSLHKALVHFTATEQLDGGERHYQCQQCKQKVKALKQLTVHKAPYVLTIHLKRFAAHDPGQKIDRKVHFGPTMDLKPFVSGSYEGDLKYTLYGVLVHSGWTTRNGHYYCFVRTSTGMWYSLDDNRVVQVSERAVLDQKAYMLFYVRDRKNFTPKKPIDVVQNQNMVANATGKKIGSCLSQDLKGSTQNHTIEKRLSVADVSVNVGLSKETQSQEGSVPKNTRFTSECLTLKKGPMSELSSKVAVTKHQVKGLPILNKTLEKYVPPSSPSVKGSSIKTNYVNSVRASTGAKINDHIEDDSSKKDQGLLDVIKVNCNSFQNSAASESDSEKTSLKVGNIGNGSTSGDSLRETADNGSIKLFTESVELSSPSGMMNGSFHVKTTDCKTHRKLKKKHMKCRIRSMHLITNTRFQIFLSSLRRKKKHKRSKRCTSDIRNLTQEHLLEAGCLSIGLGPSTSDQTQTNSVGSTHSRKKRVKHGSRRGNVTAGKDVKNSNSDCVMDIADLDFRDRIDQDDATLAMDREPHKTSSCLTAKQCDSQKPDRLNNSRRDCMQNGLMSMLTRGLDERTIARWEEVELPSSSHAKESRSMDGVAIGYIADEWDEEYDRGKLKKVRRSKNSSNGPNPFQEIATKKANLKRVKLDRSNHENQPFRI